MDSLIVCENERFDALPEAKDLSAALFDKLKSAGLKISVGESFTAGRIASAIVGTPGASAVFYEGVVAYANESKQNRLGVRAETLRDFGAVSGECCREMAEGLLAAGRCDLAISTTGIAGPRSDGTKKPVGLCYVGVAAEDGTTVYEYRLRGTREEITETAVRLALTNALDRLNKKKIIKDT